MEIEDYRRWLLHTFPQLPLHAQTTLRWIDSGWDSRILEIDDEFIFRFPRRPDVLVQYTKEVRLLPELSRLPSIEVPKFEFVHLQDSHWALNCLGYRKIPGQALDANSVMAKSPIAAQLGWFLSGLHALPISRFENTQADLWEIPVVGLPEWKQNYLEIFTQIETHAFPFFSTAARRQARDLWSLFSEQAGDFQLVLIHGDLAVEHILYDRQVETVTGIIDWGDARIGDPALDFTGLFLAGGQDLVEAVLAHYTGRIEDSFGARIQFYAGVAPFYEILYGLSCGDQAHIERGVQEFEAATFLSPVD